MGEVEKTPALPELLSWIRSLSNFLINIACVMSNTSISRFYYMLAFVEGGALMAVELLSSKLIAPYYGASLYVWTAVLGTTLGGLGLGYYLGSLYSSKEMKRSPTRELFIVSGILVCSMPWLGPLILELFLGLELRLGITLSGIILITPILTSFGMISPLIINRLGKFNASSGKVAGMVYGISTIGGILFSLVFGLYLIPYVGVKLSYLITGGLLIGAGLSLLLGARITVSDD